MYRHRGIINWKCGSLPVQSTRAVVTCKTPDDDFHRSSLEYNLPNNLTKLKEAPKDERVSENTSKKQNQKIYNF
jgi:hypothetical protein